MTLRVEFVLRMPSNNKTNNVVLESNVVGSKCRALWTQKNVSCNLINCFTMKDSSFNHKRGVMKSMRGKTISTGESNCLKLIPKINTSKLNTTVISMFFIYSLGGLFGYSREPGVLCTRVHSTQVICNPRPTNRVLNGLIRSAILI